MKKFFSLIAAVLFAGSMMADVVISGSAFAGQGTSSTGSPVSATVEGVTFECDKAYSDDAHSTLRCYKNGVITITAPEKITKLIFQFYQTYNGGLANEVVVDANEWTYTLASQARIEQVTVSFGDSPAPVVDTLNVAQAIEIASALADNASSKEYFIEGFAVNVADYYVESGTPKNQTFYIVEDAAAPDSVLQAFRATPQKEGKAYPVLAGDKVRLFGKLQKYVKNDKTQLEVVTPTVEFLSEVEGDRTIDIPVVERDTIDVAKALEIGEALDKGKATDIEYVIKGYSSVIKTAYDPGFKNESFWIVDEKGSKAASNADGAFLVFRGKPDTEKSVGIGALVYVTAKIQKYSDGVIESWSNCAVHVEEQGGEETVESINVTKALEIGNALADKAVSPEKYEITGYVSYIYSFFSKDFNNETVWISDNPENTTTENAFEIYRGKPNTAAEVGWGAKVKIVCQIKNYGGTIENDGTNLPFEVLEASPYVPDTLSIEEAVDIANALGEDAKTPKYHVIKGFIQDAPLPYNYKGSDNKWKNTTIKMSQFPNEQEGPLAVYKANILKADTAKLVQNSYAYVLGYLTKHGGAQVAEGSNVEFVEAPDMDTIHVTVAEAIAAGLDLPVEGKSDRIYAVTGFVNIVDEPFADGVETFYMADDALSEADNFLVLEVAIESEAVEGQKVEVVGRLQNTNGETVMIENGKARHIWGEGIESIVLTEKAQKVVVDGVIYIVRDNKLFNLQGAQVR